MFRIDPHTLYSRHEIKERLAGLVGLDTFLHRLGLRKGRVFRDAVWGWEIIEASKRAGSFAGRRDAPRPRSATPQCTDIRPAGGSTRRAGDGRLSVDDVRGSQNRTLPPRSGA